MPSASPPACPLFRRRRGARQCTVSYLGGDTENRNRGSAALRSLWDDGRTAYGGWCTIPSPFVAELMGAAGYDWICVDTQHGLVGYAELRGMLQALSISGTPAFVRVSGHDSAPIGKALDAGAHGIIVPTVDTAEQAHAAVAAARYPPLGERSWGPTRAALVTPGLTPDLSNRSVVVVVMIETVEALRNLDSILAVPGVDVALVGPYDLAVSSGLGTDVVSRAPEQIDGIDAVLRGCLRHRVIPGISGGDASLADRWSRLGYQLVSVGSDSALLATAVRASLAAAREGCR